MTSASICPVCINGFDKFQERDIINIGCSCVDSNFHAGCLEVLYNIKCKNKSNIVCPICNITKIPKKKIRTLLDNVKFKDNKNTYLIYFNNIWSNVQQIMYKYHTGIITTIYVILCIYVHIRADYTYNIDIYNQYINVQKQHINIQKQDIDIQEQHCNNMTCGYYGYSKPCYDFKHSDKSMFFKTINITNYKLCAQNIAHQKAKITLQYSVLEDDLSNFISLLNSGTIYIIQSLMIFGLCISIIIDTDNIKLYISKVNFIMTIVNIIYSIYIYQCDLYNYNTDFSITFPIANHIGFIIGTTYVYNVMSCIITYLYEPKTRYELKDGYYYD